MTSKARCFVELDVEERRRRMRKWIDRKYLKK